MTDRPLRVLAVDDDAVQLEMIQRSLRLEGFEVSVARAALGVSNLIRSFVPDAVLLDVNIPTLTGDRLLAVARKHAPPTTRFFLYSACDESKLRALAKETGADGWMTKSTLFSDVAARIRAACRAAAKAPR
jgi:DNA-binding response OmpR family regulator